MNMPDRPARSMAGLSLVMGILGLTVLPLLGSLVAIVTGHLARAQIRRNPQLGGDTLAMAGLVFGWLAVLLAALIAAVFFLVFGGSALLG